MKQREKTSLQSSSVQELKKSLQMLKKELVEVLKERYTNASKNVRKAKMIRKNIAIIKTCIRGKELETV